jgi:c-di-GMP-binding flagellar brake protein YcgR
LNICEGGARIRVEKAMSIATEKNLVLGTKLVEPGQTFQILKLNKVPRCPAVMEFTGKAVYIAHDGDGIVLGFSFDKLRDDLKNAIQTLVASRATPLPTEVPPKLRRKPEKKVEEEPTPPEALIPITAILPGVSIAAPKESTPAQKPEGENWQERRRFPRMSTSGMPYGVRFRLQDREVKTARLSNLSASGCGLELQMIDVLNLELGLVLHDFYLEHPDLPLVPLHAEVVRILGKVPGKTQGYALVGLEFTQMGTHVQTLIANHVVARLEAQES